MKKIIPMMALLICNSNVSATDYLITTGVDDQTDNGNCTLREALLAADTQSAVDQCAAGTTDNVIVLDHTVGTFNFNQGEMVISGSQTLTIETSDLNATAPIINMAFNNRFLASEVADLILSISGVDFAFGHDDSGEGGGVIWVDSGTEYAHLDISDVTFLSNTSVAADGGAVLFRGKGEIDVRNTLFQGNAADGGSGLAMDVVDSDHSSSFINVEFINNDSKQGRGALTIYTDRTIVRLTLITVTDNLASGGEEIAGIYIDVNNMSITNNSMRVSQLIIEDNLGSGLYVNHSGGFVQLQSIILKDNFKPSGQGIHQAIVNSSSINNSARLDNILIYQSTTQQGIGLLLGVESDESNLRIGHATILNHAIGVLGNSVASNPMFLELGNSIVFGNVNNLNNFDLDVDSLIGIDPMFTDSANEDFSLTAASPALDSGTEIIGLNSDLNFNPRIYNVLPDAGAYERQGPVNANVTFIGSGTGTINYTTQFGLNDSCSSDCTFEMQSNEWIDLDASPDSGVVSGLWGDDCIFAEVDQSCFISFNFSGSDRNISIQFIDESEIIFNNGFEVPTP